MWCFKNVIFGVILALFSCQVDSSEQIVGNKPEVSEEGSGMELTVLSYNVHHCNPPSKPGVIDLEAVANVLKNSEAAIIGLQEIDVYTERSGKDLDMTKELAERADYPYYYFSKSIDYQGGAYGTAILSKYPLSETETIALPNPAGSEPRTLSVATVTINDTLQIRFGNTHLDYTNALNNMEQVKAMSSNLSQSDIPVILTGDFNAKPDADSMNYLAGFFQFSCRVNCSYTSPASNPNKTIDYIVFRNGNHKIKKMSHSVLPENYASDHLAVKATLKVY